MPAQRHDAVGRRVADRVVDQVLEHPHDLVVVGLDQRQADGQALIDPHALRARRHLEPLHRGVDDRVGHQRLEIERHPALLHLRDIEQVVDQLEHGLAAMVSDLEQFLLLIGDRTAQAALDHHDAVHGPGCRSDRL